MTSLQSKDEFQSQDIICFGPFRLFPAARRLERDGKLLNLGSRALDILIILAERAPEIVSKKDLFSAVWPGVTVDEGALRFHIANLRKALGDGQSNTPYVTNVSGRGYCFVAPISRSGEPGPLPNSAPNPVANLPARLMRMVGRDEIVEEISAQLAARRFVTIVGPGGIGKTTVAVWAGHALLPAFCSSVYFVDLGPLNHSSFVPRALASTLGLVIDSGYLIPNLIQFLKDKHMLLVLDSCEHVIEAVAELAESIVEDAPQVHILATSRESLRVEGEHVHRLFPLDFPQIEVGLTAAKAMTFPAVQLFVERVIATWDRFALSDADAPIVAGICRKLDGIALAIELAAGRVEAHGIQGIASLLDNQFGLSWQGRRTALPRHQTLSATLDWSYGLLSDFERLVLRRLSVFVGIFTLEAAKFVGCGNEDDCAEVVDALASLVAKSLVSADAAGPITRYRLLDTTRAYVMGKLLESGDIQAIARRHALYFCEYLTRADATVMSLSEAAAEVGSYGDHIGNVRAALEWSFSPHGDLQIGTALATVSANLFREMSLWTECELWCERAIAALGDTAPGTLRELALQTSLGMSMIFTGGNQQDVQSTLSRGLELAEDLKEPRYQLLLLEWLYTLNVRIADFDAAVAYAQRMKEVAEEIADSASVAAAERILGNAHHLTGHQASAQRHCERALRYPHVSQSAHILRSDIVHRFLALSTLARTLWLRGYPDQAVRVAGDAIEEAEILKIHSALASALMWVAPVYLWIGDWTTTGETIERLTANTRTLSLTPFGTAALGLKGELCIKLGAAETGVRHLRDYLAAPRVEQMETLTPVFECALAGGLAKIEEFDEALAVVDRAMAKIEYGGESFYAPEILRIKGGILASLAPSEIAQAEDCLVRSLELAHSQSALSWELRAATSLARLRSRRGCPVEAHAVLAPIYNRFGEGFETLDLREAKGFLKELEHQSSTRSLRTGTDL
jgi:predicted ATPase/DNA-binding winged helix-turn-helix (wHTH) protein